MNSRRSCGSCTACCDAIGVEEINKPEFTPCKHLCGTGCGIYKKRPTQCREYSCAWKILWAPGDESWRPDNLGAIFDIHERGMGGICAAIRCWQLRSATQILDDPRVRQMAYSLAIQFNQPVVARYGNVMNMSLHLISPVKALRVHVRGVEPPVPAYLLTYDVISDPQDFDRERKSPSDKELDELMSQFGVNAFIKEYNDLDQVREKLSATVKFTKQETTR
jgi:hypothetical protein